jgi:4'-phosphopantetheinyl transferase
MDVYWLEQTEADVPAENDWLSVSETIRLNGMRFAKRRADWRLGRWTAKRAVAAYLDMSLHPAALSAIEIRPAPSGAPEVFIAQRRAAIAISISHRAGTAACALARAGAALGCDLETIEARSDAFVADYFTTEEQALVARAADPPRLANLIWSGKESALKALRAGLRLDTRCVIVSPFDGPGRGGENGEGREENSAFGVRSSPGVDSWQPLHVRYDNNQSFHGWWQLKGNLLRTTVAAPPPFPPILLKIPAEPASTNSRRDIQMPLNSRSRAAAVSGVMSRCGDASIS